jgi:hypothetical protein
VARADDCESRGRRKGKKLEAPAGELIRSLACFADDTRRDWAHYAGRHPSRLDDRQVFVLFGFGRAAESWRWVWGCVLVWFDWCGHSST